jgi:NAD(P)-dependent dehydrogenase (short-subunit alcohol dehydrogenase family)
VRDYTPPPGHLADRIVLVTGAGDGIGRAAAQGFAAAGATVILLGRTVRKLEAVYDAIVKAGHPEPAIYPMDLRGATPGDYDDLATRVEKEFNRLDGLLHNAATLGSLTPIEHYDVNTWFDVLQVNLSAPFLLTRACMKLLKRSDDGSVVFVSDAVGRKGRAYWGAYGVSKFGLEGLMQILADELENTPSLRVNSVDPGPTRTMLRARAYPGEKASTIPAPEEALGPLLYLMGPDSRGVTGRAF